MLERANPRAVKRHIFVLLMSKFTETINLQELSVKDLLDKIGSYNIFNFLFPGVVFAVFVSKVTSYNLVQSDVLVGAFFYYFIGAVVNRIGSLIIEPFLKATKLVVFSSYENFVRASKDDPKLEVLSETNNMYRTICALLLCIGVTYFYEIAESHFGILKQGTPFICIVGLFVLFALSYRKQTAYIGKRITANLKIKGEA
jgi:hypothetical protein